MDQPQAGPLSPAYLSMSTSSFTEFVRAQSPDLLPARRQLGDATALQAPHGTTIVALTFSGGVVIAGDRRATAGNTIAARDLEKVDTTDADSAGAAAATAGITLAVVRVYAGGLA